MLLLANLNVIPLPSLAFLFRLWPVVLIVAGIADRLARAGLPVTPAAKVSEGV